MRAKLINLTESNHNGYGAVFWYYLVYICCENCRGKYILNNSRGIHNWELREGDNK